MAWRDLQAAFKWSHAACLVHYIAEWHAWNYAGSAIQELIGDWRLSICDNFRGFPQICDFQTIMLFLAFDLTPTVFGIHSWSDKTAWERPIFVFNYTRVCSGAVTIINFIEKKNLHAKFPEIPEIFYFVQKTFAVSGWYAISLLGRQHETTASCCYQRDWPPLTGLGKKNYR